MPIYFFDVQIGEQTEADSIGSELVSSGSVAAMALDLCLKIAQERMPGHSDVRVSVRAAEGQPIYQADITLFGSWT